MKEAIVLAGGFGTRLRSVLSDRPKPLAPIADRPFLSYILDLLCFYGYNHVVISSGYLSEYVVAQYPHHYKGMTVSHAVESQPLGTGGGLVNAMRLCKEESVTVLNGDTLFLIDLEKFLTHHQSSAADITLAVREVPDATRYGAVDVDSTGRIVKFNEKSSDACQGLINGGIYRLNRSLFAPLVGSDNLSQLDAQALGLVQTSSDGSSDSRGDEYSQASSLPNPFSLEKDLLVPFVAKLHVAAFVSNAYFIDIGIPQDYSRAKKELPKLMECYQTN